MSSAEELEKQLKELQRKREEEEKVKRLQRQIKAEQFAQTKSGKVINVLGSFAERVGKKIATPSPKQRPVKKKKIRMISSGSPFGMSSPTSTLLFGTPMKKPKIPKQKKSKAITITQGGTTIRIGDVSKKLRKKRIKQKIKPPKNNIDWIMRI